MNMQAIMQQAQRMEKELTKKKEELDKKKFVGSSELVDVELSGSKKVLSVKIKAEGALEEEEDKEILQDMIVLAMNDALKKIDDETSSMLGSYGKLSGLL